MKKPSTVNTANSGTGRNLLLLAFLLVWMEGHSQAVTYRTVEPIFLNRCVACHRAGDAAPFALDRYEDIVKRLSFIKEVITSGYMPPWKPDPHYQEYGNDRRLTEQERKTLLEWIDRKAPRGAAAGAGDAGKGGGVGAGDGGRAAGAGNGGGDAARAALMKVSVYKRKPDLTLKIDSAFTVKGDNTERFIAFKVPYEFGEERAVEAIEFYTNNKRIVHHINYGFYEVADQGVDIRQGPALVNSADDDRRGSDPFGRINKKMVYYTGWIPGTSYESYPKGFGWVLPKRGVLLLTAHYSALAKDEESIVGVHLFFRKDTIRRNVQIISLGSGGVGESDIFPPLFIPAGKVRTYHLQVKTKDEQSLLCVWPHMHLLGKEFWAYAVTPSGDTIHLVHIANWDFRWQELYKFKGLVRIPKGSVVNLDCTYDNTADNPMNPNHPPRGVLSVGDMSSTNEMMTLLLIYVAYRDGDEQLKLGD